MPIVEKGFAGVMNLDDNNDVLPQTHHKEAYNISFRGNGANQIAQNILGNREIANTLPAGVNSCIGDYYDELNARLFYFNYNSNGNHGIYMYDIATEVITALFLSKIDSILDVLNFDITKPITSINILYGDAYNATLDTEGSVLYWVDSLGRPSKLNIERRIANVYYYYDRSYLDVAKAPPIMPIKATYENDITTGVSTSLTATVSEQSYTTSSLLKFDVSTNTGFNANAQSDTFISNIALTYVGTLSFPVSISVTGINPVLNSFKIRLLKNSTEIASYTYTVSSVPYSVNVTLSATSAISLSDILQVDVQADASYTVLPSALSSVSGDIEMSTITNNNLKNSLFQFIYRYVYDDGEKSVWSSGSTVCLPLFSNNQSVVSNFSKNSRINLYLSTGNETVRKIEIAVRKSSDGIVSDYGLVTSLPKRGNVSEIIITDNDVYSYKFYNNSVLVPIDQSEVVLLYDYVPDKVNAQELLNGNTLIYGGITEGYDQLSNTVFSMTSDITNGFDNINGLLFFASQYGQTSYGYGNSIKVVLTGAGANSQTTDLPIRVTSALGASFYIQLRNDSTNTSYNINYLSSATDNVNTILTGLAASATSQGFTTSISNNELIITRGSGLRYWLRSSYARTSNSAAAFSSTYKTNVLYSNLNAANYKYGLVYYDRFGKTNGVVVKDGIKITTPRYNSDTEYPFVRTFIYHTPPIWAYYYHIVRTENLTYSKNLMWVSDRAFANFTTYSTSANEYSIAYIGIGNMSYYNEQIQATSGYVSYDYSPGDRVKILARISSSGVKTNFNTGTARDFEIIGLESDPNINGYIAQGTYIKIKYPEEFIDSNLQFFQADPIEYAGTGDVENYQNYEIQIYSYKQRSETKDVYYEIGEQYNIVNPTLSNRYHAGKDQSQSASAPAQTNIYTGDNFYRYRDIPIGASYSFAAGTYTQNDGGSIGQYCTTRINVWNSVNTPKTISTTNYDIKSQVPVNSGLGATIHPNYLTPDYIFYNKSASNMTIRFKGSIPASTITTKNQYIVVRAKIVTSTTSATVKTIVRAGSITTTNTQYDFPFDSKIVVPPLAKVFIITECEAQSSNSLLVGSFLLQLDVMTSVKVAVIESSFSDVFKQELSSNSRSLIYDENARKCYYPTVVRFGLNKIMGSTLNQTNRFYPANMDEYDKQKGDVQRLKVRGNQMRVFQNRGCGVAMILENMIFNADGGDNLIQTNKLINKIHYYQGDYGIGGLTTSIASSSGADYFVDPIRGYQVRLSQDGMTPISELYKAQYYITSLSNRYTRNRIGDLGGYAKVLGVYDFYEEEYVSVFQGSSAGANTTIGFNEKKNCYTSFYDYAPEWITSVESTLISFKDGKLWRHDNTGNRNTFYGVTYPSSLTLVYNPNPTIKKDFNSISQDAQTAWVSVNNSDITTSLNQQSNLVTADYELNEGFYHASFMRDANSIGGVIEGDYLKGTWLQTKLSNNSTNFVYLSGVYVNFTVSQRNG